MPSCKTDQMGKTLHYQGSPILDRLLAPPLLMSKVCQRELPSWVAKLLYSVLGNGILKPHMTTQITRPMPALPLIQEALFGLPLRYAQNEETICLDFSPLCSLKWKTQAWSLQFFYPYFSDLADFRCRGRKAICIDKLSRCVFSSGPGKNSF